MAYGTAVIECVNAVGVPVTVTASLIVSVSVTMSPGFSVPVPGEGDDLRHRRGQGVDLCANLRQSLRKRCEAGGGASTVLHCRAVQIDCGR